MLILNKPIFMVHTGNFYFGLTSNTCSTTAEWPVWGKLTSTVLLKTPPVRLKPLETPLLGVAKSQAIPSPMAVKLWRSKPTSFGIGEMAVYVLPSAERTYEWKSDSSIEIPFTFPLNFPVTLIGVSVYEEGKVNLGIQLL